MAPAGRRPRTRRALLLGAASWVVSTAAWCGAVVLADHGAPAWAFALLFLWLVTAGLPTLLSVVTVAALWGRAPGMRSPSPGVALAAVALTSLLVQMSAVLLLEVARARRRDREP